MKVFKRFVNFFVPKKIPQNTIIFGRLHGISPRKKCSPTFSKRSGRFLADLLIWSRDTITWNHAINNFEVCQRSSESTVWLRHYQRNTQIEYATYLFRLQICFNHDRIIQIFQAIAETVRNMNWHSFTHVYQTPDALLRIAEALENKGTRIPITFKELPPLKKIKALPNEKEQSLVYESFLKKLQSASQFSLLIDIEADNLAKFLDTMNSMGIMGDYFMGLISNLVSIRVTIFILLYWFFIQAILVQLVQPFSSSR